MVERDESFDVEALVYAQRCGEDEKRAV